MPVYTYYCQACDTQFERSQRMSDPPITECECGKKGQVKRLLSAGAGLIFKGSGFYITDYKNGSGNGSGASEKSSEPAAPAAAPAPAPVPSGGGTCGSGGCPSCS